LILQKISPGLKKCETEEILPRIGIEKYNELKLKRKQGDLNSNDIILLKLIQNALVYYSLSWAMPRFSVTLFPEGVLQYYSSDRISTIAKKPSLNIEPEQARVAFQKDYEEALVKIENFINVPIIESNLKPDDFSLKNDTNNKYFTT
jgi:hypothetical protein